MKLADMLIPQEITIQNAFKKFEKNLTFYETSQNF